jgi:hypothetical protein
MKRPVIIGMRHWSSRPLPSSGQAFAEMTPGVPPRVLTLLVIPYFKAIGRLWLANKTFTTSARELDDFNFAER